MATEAPHLNPVEQFSLRHFVELHPLGFDASFSNASLFMIIVLGLATLLMVVATSGKSLVPSRGQAAAEMAYEFVAQTIRQSAGSEGMKFFPFVFSLFLFVLGANLISLVPYTFAVTSQIIVTFSLAATVMIVVIVYGFYKHGLGFLRLFVPSGVAWPILIILTPIEIISFFARLISLSVRLFANMLAGHITLQLFGGFVVMLISGGAVALLAPIPLLAIVALYALELLVAVVQAYIFAVLTCVYLNDAIHPGH